MSDETMLAAFEANLASDEAGQIMSNGLVPPWIIEHWFNKGYRIGQAATAAAVEKKISAGEVKAMAHTWAISRKDNHYPSAYHSYKQAIHDFAPSLGVKVVGQLLSDNRDATAVGVPSVIVREAFEAIVYAAYNRDGDSNDIMSDENIVRAALGFPKSCLDCGQGPCCMNCGPAAAPKAAEGCV